MLRRPRRLLFFWAALGLGLLLAAAGAARAEGESDAEHAAAHEGAGEPEGIVNWFSWDYGPNAKDPSHRGWPPPFGIAIINFVVFAGILARLGGPQLKTFVRDRHLGIRKELDEAGRLRKEAEQKLGEYERKIAGIDTEIDALLGNLRREAEADKQRIIAAAESEATRLKAEAQRQIDIEIDRARAELRRGVVEAAVAAAESILEKQVGSDDHRKLAERYVAEIESPRRTA
jgi:F-type H+-transporting ATPase subunit b